MNINNELFYELVTRSEVPIHSVKAFRGYIDLKKFAGLVAEECKKISLTCSHRGDDMGAIIARKIDQQMVFGEYDV